MILTQIPTTSVSESAAPQARTAQLRIAIVHYWLVGPGGGEKVVEAILEMYPQADVFTLIHDPEFSRRMMPNTKIVASFLQRIPFAKRVYRALLPLMPMALENLDLKGYDLIISSESGPAKGILPPLGAVHVCYCHSPMRYIWDQFHEYGRDGGRLTRLMMHFCVTRLRLWDQMTAARVDLFIANSRHVRRRIGQYYRRDAEVLHPPVDIAAFAPGEERGDYYLITGRHVGYKRIDLAIAACERLNRRLVVTGMGPQTDALKRLAGPNVTFTGHCTFDDLKRHYAACRAFLMPGEEDFGIAPVEAMASGRPVIALGKGGALDTVVPGVSGILFDESTVDSLVGAIERFEHEEASFDAQHIRDHAKRFSREAFKQGFARLVERALAMREPWVVAGGDLSSLPN